MISIARLLLLVLGRFSDRTIAALARLLFSRSWRAFEHATEHPAEVQMQRLRLILDRAKDTEFGRAHGFAQIQTLDDYQAKVPIRGFDDFEPYLTRMTKGEANVLIPDVPTFFARSSGTTGTPKLIPITDVYLAEYRTPRRVWIRQVVQAFPGLVRGKILTVHSPKIEGRTEAGVPFGSITVAMSGSPDAGEVPGEAFDVDPVPRRVFLLDDFQAKYYTILRVATQEDIRLCAAVNPSTLVLLADKLDEFADRLIADLEAGTHDGLHAIDEPLKSQLQAKLTTNPAAAARIRAAKDAHGRVRPTDVWPNIEGLLCWKGGSAPFYLQQLEDLYPGKAMMDYGFLATEGGFSIPLSPDGAKGVVAVGGHVLEFAPEDGEGAVVLADALEIGRRYRVIITGSHGLYRYDINDVVECVGRYRNTAEIAFVHKGGNMLSVTGEKIAESHVVQAVSRASAEAGIELAGFSVSVALDKPPCYLFGVEPKAELQDGQKAKLLDACEANLRAVNIEYEAKRASSRLGAPRLLVLSRGAFERERRRRVQAGAPDSHVKPPHLMAQAELLEGLGVESVFGGDG